MAADRNPYNLQPGQTLYVPQGKREFCREFWLRVVKVNRDYATIERENRDNEAAPKWRDYGRIYLRNLSLEGESEGQGRAFLSREAWEDDVLRDDEWKLFKNRLSWRCPDRVSRADIVKLSAIVFGEDDPGPAGTVRKPSGNPVRGS